MVTVKREHPVFHASIRRGRVLRRPTRPRSLADRITRPRPLADRITRPPAVTKPTTKLIPLKRLNGRKQRDRTFHKRIHGTQEIECPDSGLRRLESDSSSLVVAVDGVCRGNGQVGAQAGYGVWFSHDRVDLNTQGTVPIISPQTNQCAYLYGMKEALDIIQELMIAGEDLTHVVIQTNSRYLLNGLSRDVWKWRVNGYKAANRQPVVHGRMFKFLHERVELLEKEYRIVVSFCFVQKEDNTEANGLAQASLH